MYNYNEYNRDYGEPEFNSGLFDFDRFSELTEGKNMSLGDMIDAIHGMEKNGEAYITVDSPVQRRVQSEDRETSVKYTTGLNYEDLQTYDMGLNVYRELGNACSMVVLTEGNSVMDLEFAGHVMDLKRWEEPFQEHKIIAAYKLLGFQSLKSKKEEDICEELTLMEMVEDFFDCFEPDTILITRTKLRYRCNGKEYIEDSRKDEFRDFVFKSTNIGAWKNYGDRGEVKVNCDGRYIPKVEDILQCDLSNYSEKHPKTLEVEEWTVEEGKAITAYSLIGEEILDSYTPLLLKQAGINSNSDSEVLKAMTSDENLFSVMIKSNLMQDDFVTVDASLPSRSANMFKSMLGVFSESVDHSVSKVIKALERLNYDVYIWEEDRMTRTCYDDLLETHKDRKGFIEYFQEKLWFRDELQGHYWKLRLDSKLGNFPKSRSIKISGIESNTKKMTNLESFELKRSLKIHPVTSIIEDESSDSAQEEFERVFQRFREFESDHNSSEENENLEDYSERHFSDVPKRSQKELSLEAEVLNNQVQIGTIASVVYEFDESGPHHMKEFVCVGNLEMKNGDRLVSRVDGGRNKKVLKSAVITCLISQLQIYDPNWKRFF